MLTRSAAKRIAEGQDAQLEVVALPSPTKRRAVQVSQTVMEVTASTTGQGTHTRWIRAPVLPSSSSVSSTHPEDDAGNPTIDSEDPRYVTPPPHIPTEPPPTPPRNRVRGTPLERRARLGNPGVFNLATVLMTVHVPANINPDEVARYVTKAVEHKYYPKSEGLQMLGPQGTVLVDERDRPILGSPFQSPISRPPQAPPLGPCGTHLILHEDEDRMVQD